MKSLVQHTYPPVRVSTTAIHDDGKHPLWMALKLKIKVSKGFAIALCRSRGADPYVRVKR
jgi:hypothetical protein